MIVQKSTLVYKHKCSYCGFLSEGSINPEPKLPKGWSLVNTDKVYHYCGYICTVSGANFLKHDHVW